MTQLSIADVSTMFQDCILEHENELVVVRDVIEKEDGIKLAIRKFGTSRNVLIDPDPDALFCPSMPYRLGYVQYSGELAAYLSRSPRRQYKVGWCQNNVNGLTLTAALSQGVKFVGNLLGQFPTFTEAMELAKQTSGSVAFDRQFALTENAKILAYKGRQIAFMRGNDADLSGGFEYLRDLFNQAKERK